MLEDGNWYEQRRAVEIVRDGEDIGSLDRARVGLTTAKTRRVLATLPCVGASDVPFLQLPEQNWRSP